MTMTRQDIEDLFEVHINDVSHMASILTNLLEDSICGTDMSSVIGRLGTDSYHITPMARDNIMFSAYKVLDNIRDVEHAYEEAMEQARSTVSDNVANDAAELTKFIHDPLLVEINNYKAAWDHFCAVEDEDQSGTTTWRPGWERLVAWKEPAATREGAIAALNLAIAEEDIGESKLTAVMMKAALGFLDPTANVANEPAPVPEPVRAELEIISEINALNAALKQVGGRE